MTISRDQIRKWEQARQIQLMHNALHKIRRSAPLTNTEAERVLDELELIWRDELERINKENRTDELLVILETPESGLLSSMGYRVGARATEERLRQDILKWILFREIPFVHSLGYSRQWGAPGSNKRFRKLEGVLWQFIDGAEGRGGYGQAVTHWRRDLAFIRERISSAVAAE